jgi:phosphoribosyl 1,2-cyclic phosphodiesterase
VRLIILGARGSTPTPGAAFVRYGGNTSCIAVSGNGAVPRLVLDAGTGLIGLTPHLAGDAFKGTIVLGHLHWDHTHGLPFFGGGNRPDAEVRVLIPDQGEDPEEMLARAISPPHFPVRPRELTGKWSFENIEAGEYQLEGFRVLARDIPHKGGRMYGFRVSDGDRSVAYLSDHSPTNYGPGETGLGEIHAAAIELAQGADLLIHDAQYTAEEFLTRSHYGHSSIEYPAGLARAAGVKRLLLFHHDPGHTDDQLDAIVAAARAAHPDLVIDAAVEGSVLEV